MYGTALVSEECIGRTPNVDSTVVVVVEHIVGRQ